MCLAQLHNTVMPVRLELLSLESSSLFGAACYIHDALAHKILILIYKDATKSLKLAINLARPYS